MTSNFKLYSQYYDLLYQDKDTTNEVRYIYNYLQKAAVGGKVWLELGAGSGRHGKILSELGINWSGIELSQEMADLGQAMNLPIQVGDVRSTIIAEEKFDAVLALFHVISYLTTSSDVLTTFRNVHRQLKPEGLFFFDVWYTPAVLTQVPQKRIKEVNNDQIAVSRLAQPMMNWDENTVSVHYQVKVTELASNTVTSFEEHHLMRHFSMPEILLFAELTGFNLISCEEWLTGKTPGPDTWGVAFLLKKI